MFVHMVQSLCSMRYANYFGKKIVVSIEVSVAMTHDVTRLVCCFFLSPLEDFIVSARHIVSGSVLIKIIAVYVSIYVPMNLESVYDHIQDYIRYHQVI
jgi:hypothetical protein